MSKILAKFSSCKYNLEYIRAREGQYSEVVVLCFCVYMFFSAQSSSSWISISRSLYVDLQLPNLIPISTRRTTPSTPTPFFLSQRSSPSKQHNKPRPYHTSSPPLFYQTCPPNHQYPFLLSTKFTISSPRSLLARFSTNTPPTALSK